MPDEHDDDIEPEVNEGAELEATEYAGVTGELDENDRPEEEGRSRPAEKDDDEQPAETTRRATPFKKS